MRTAKERGEEHMYDFTEIEVAAKLATLSAGFRTYAAVLAAATTDDDICGVMRSCVNTTGDDDGQEEHDRRQEEQHGKELVETAWQRWRHCFALHFAQSLNSACK
jgi:hypothetical protein